MSKVKSGEVAEWEVEVFKALFSAVEKKGVSDELRYVASAIAGSTLYVAVEGNEIAMLEDEVSRALSIPRVARVRMLFFKGGELGLLERIYGQKVLSVNKVYDPDGSIQVYVKVPRPDPGADKLASLLLKVRVQSIGSEEQHKAERVSSTRRADVRKLLEKLFM
ncbi:MAG: hypothetical protein QXF57_05000 [Acidilobaceae archaeon]